MLYTNIDWALVDAKVKKLQSKIVIAWRDKDNKYLSYIQWKLVTSFEARALAVKQVCSNIGRMTPGIDGVLWTLDEDKINAIHNLTQSNYSADPVKRIYIPKEGKAEKRPLGIPTMKDRAMQALWALALAPIAEEVADQHSYGSRLKRSAQCAMEVTHKILSGPNGPRFILEADIVGFFDNINHDWILEHIPINKTVLKEWLNAGVLYQGKLSQISSGVPQGGVISPMIANMCLDGLEVKIKSNLPRKLKYPKVHVVRYLDDLLLDWTS